MNEDKKNNDVLVLSIEDRARMTNAHLKKIFGLWKSNKWQFDEEQLIAFENGFRIGYETAFKDMSEISTSIAGAEEQLKEILKRQEEKDNKQ